MKKKIFLLFVLAFIFIFSSCDLNTKTGTGYQDIIIPPAFVPSENEIENNELKNETNITLNSEVKTDFIETNENYSINNIEESVVKVSEFADYSSIMIKVSSKKITNEFEYEGFGSGVIYNKNEETKTYSVLTNKHVVEGAKHFKIKTIYEEVDAYLYNISSNYDVAIIYFNSDFEYNISKFEKEDNIKKGQYAIAIGTPLDEEYFNSLSLGNISLITNDYIKHTASLNSGNSGGALYNLNGNLIGLNYQKISGESNSGAIIEGQFFALSLSTLKEAIKDMTSIKLGITVTEISNILEYHDMVKKIPSYSNYFDIETKQFYNDALNYIPEGITTGVIVLSVEETGIATQKLEKFDIIYKINDINITKTTDIRHVLVNYQQDTQLTVYVYRNKCETSISIIN